jgi:general secretion pathway protein G
MVGANESEEIRCVSNPTRHCKYWQARRRRVADGVSCGFTLIELMIVVAIISILIGIAAGMYQRSVQKAKEATLKSDLSVMRQAIDHYTLDKEAAPQSLEDLVNPQTQYMREIPTDPMTNAKDWHVDFGDTVLSPDQSSTGIVDVHSNSDKISPFEGTPYNTW